MLLSPHPIQISCGFETMPWNAQIGLIVNKESATLPGYDHFSIPANHKDMTKFSSSDDIGFCRVSNVLRRWVREIDQTDETDGMPQVFVDTFSELVTKGMDWDEWLQQRKSENPSYLKTTHGDLMDNTYTATSNIVRWRIQGGLTIWEVDEELHRQDVQWTSFRNLNHGPLSEFVATIHLGHVISRTAQQWHGAGLLLRAADNDETVLAFIFTGQTRGASVVRVPPNRLIGQQDTIFTEYSVPCLQEPDRWPEERDKIRLGCFMEVSKRKSASVMWRISEHPNGISKRTQDFCEKVPELRNGIKDVGISCDVDEIP
ncbi:sesB-related regulatory [Fusarium mexicanum]|uniref:SesB-related regulatory n=1 Tax=Fusarium mexicanum TaxID=751941 RepID=A0A8H5MX22_9HYPO|nr:sesB-related regulatory [Fusarium mexicanum]